MENKIYQVFISSTYTDLHEERRSVAEAISKSGQIPAGMEYFPASSQKQFEYIKKIIDRCDYYVLIIAGRYGTVSETGLSFTEEEYRYAVSKNIPILAFINNDVGNIVSEKVEIDKEKIDKLETFRKEVSASRIVEFWKHPKELPGKVAIAVAQEINLNPGIGWVRGNQAFDPKIYEENRILREELQKYKESAQPINFTFPSNLPDINEEFIITFRKMIYEKNKYYGKGNFTKEESYILETTWKDIFLKISESIQDGVSHSWLEKNYENILIEATKEEYEKSGNIYLEYKCDLKFEKMINLMISYDLIEPDFRNNTNAGTYYKIYNLTTKGTKFKAFLNYRKNIDTDVF